MKQSKTKFNFYYDYHEFFLISWILDHFYIADKDGSGTLTKQECRSLLVDILNANVSDNDFEKIFKVKLN